MADLTVGGGPPSGGEAQTFTVTTFAQSFLDDADAGAVRTTIGAGTSSFSGAYSDLTGKPTLAGVATSGSYNDLSDKPAIPTLAWGNMSGTLSSQTDLQAALDAKMATGYLVLPRTVSASVTVPTGSDIYIPEGATLTGQIVLQGDARMVFVKPTGATKFG